MIQSSSTAPAVIAKFTQHEDLRELLLGTGDSKIIEHTTNDDYWGDGGDGRGKNMLGRLLMEMRTQARTQEDDWKSAQNTSR